MRADEQLGRKHYAFIHVTPCLEEMHKTARNISGYRSSVSRLETNRTDFSKKKHED
jgi:hypothetical protein